MGKRYFDKIVVLGFFGKIVSKMGPNLKWVQNEFFGKWKHDMLLFF